MPLKLLIVIDTIQGKIIEIFKFLIGIFNKNIKRFYYYTKIKMYLNAKIFKRLKKNKNKNFSE